ncbi:gamma-tubulin complex component 3-like protein [Perkinsela sp. CCAP 1560/4]|nr:gamma-tubulin complex component 3-like protein [Perkinsela sp. CCAP 1560/4]|eukprot:KNH07127.1 gamma-tubulin complex component 3-like protein [Perkinsela sp. CCAP 1560/4]
MVGIVVGNYMKISIKDRTAPSGISQKNVDQRIFEGFRFLGQALTHENRFFLDSLDELRQYHKPGNIYEMPQRQTYNPRTYEVALAICNAYPHEPFQLKEIDSGLIFTKHHKLVVSQAELQLLDDFNATYNVDRKVNVGNRIVVDGILQNDTHACMFTSMDSFSERHIRQWHSELLFCHYYQKKSQDMKQTKLWRTMFGKKVHLYIGFRNAMITETQAKFVRSLRIRPLIRKGFQSFVC